MSVDDTAGDSRRAGLLGRLVRTATRPVRMWWTVVSSLDTPVGTTPRDEVWSINRVRLFRYRSAVPPEERHSVPLLLVYAIINRPFILDLRPGRSFVEFLVGRGFDVWLIDWGDPGPEDAEVTFDDYAARYLPRVMRRLLRHTAADQVSLLGYCIGASITLEYTALHPERVANLVLVTTPLDLSGTGDSLFTLWLDRRWHDPERVVAAFRNLPEGAIEMGSKMLKPVANYVGSYLSLWDRLDVGGEAVTNWQALHRWVHDGVAVPGAAYRQWVEDFMWNNALAAGTHRVDGRPVDLSTISAPVLAVTASLDHIVPRHQSRGIQAAVSSTDVTEVEVEAGHVGLMAGGSAKRKTWPIIADWLEERLP